MECMHADEAAVLRILKRGKKEKTMEEFKLAGRIADEELDHVSGGRKLTAKEEENINKADQKAVEMIEILQEKQNTAALRKFREEYYEASYRYTRSILNDKIAPDTVMFSDFFETYYGWPC